ncbi:MAG: metal-dependent transcriptional regulator [Coriobacteriales bacterium]|nr:metal-dependent transcriptional regulator [Actinomycetes bacterium]
MPSETIEEYLETIYKLSERGDVRPARIAETLGVSGPTVTATLGRLANAGYVTRPAGGVALTESGLQAALSIVRRHRLAERLLVDVLGMPWEDVHEEACRLEHALSDNVQVALERYLDNPGVCPHGHPIPAADGTVARSEGLPLSGYDPGAEVVIVRIDDEDEELLGYLSSLDLFPGTHVVVADVAPFDGPLTVEVDGVRHALGRGVADKIIVAEPARSRESE